MTIANSFNIEMIAITLLLLPFNIAMYTGKGTNGLEEAGRAIEKLEGELEPFAPPQPQIPHFTSSISVGPHPSDAFYIGPHPSDALHVGPYSPYSLHVGSDPPGAFTIGPYSPYSLHVGPYPPNPLDIGPHPSNAFSIGPYPPYSLDLAHSSHPYDVNSEVKYGLYPNLPNPLHVGSDPSGAFSIGPYPPYSLDLAHSSHPYGINSEVKDGLYPNLPNPLHIESYPSDLAHSSVPNKHSITEEVALVESSELENVGNGAGKFSLKRLTRKQKIAFTMVFFGLLGGAAISVDLLKKKYFSHRSKKLQNSTLVLTPDNAHSTTLNNAYSTANIAEHSSSKIFVPSMNVNKELAHTMSETLAANTKQSSDSVTTHGHVHIKHTHTMHKLAVYIAVTTALLIAACILVLHMVKLYRQDVVTDMQQYYTGGASTAMQSNMNVPLYQHGNLI